MAPLVLDCLSLFISAGFLVFIVAGWIIVKGHSVIPIYMYLFITPLAIDWKQQWHITKWRGEIGKRAQWFFTVWQKQ
ncbi:unnamed protein product [Orchesella dallaii]|uniref:Uncharacterized protein n=1 Tax=Orchesella dallaii TaxID=48710 RepID=A0ABP1S757_9HEXA